MAIDSQLLASIPLYPDQELHLRLRQAEGIPTMIELSQFNTEGQGYRLACPFPDDPEVVDALIKALQDRQAARG